MTNGVCGSASTWRPLRRLATETRASQIVEFAVALPLLLVVVVGIFDFGNAFNLKQKLTNAAREGARAGAGQSTIDLSDAPPQSVLAIRDLVTNYLQTSKVNDCGMGSAAAVWVGAAAPWSWTFTVACPGAGNFVLTVNRGQPFTSTVTTGGNAVKVLTTKVTVQYPYRWKFNRVIGLLVPSASYPGTSQIVVAATMANES
jgi:Flp pilus assembly protein TadG